MPRLRACVQHVLAHGDVADASELPDPILDELIAENYLRSWAIVLAVAAGLQLIVSGVVSALAAHHLLISRAVLGGLGADNPILLVILAMDYAQNMLMLVQYGVWRLLRADSIGLGTRTGVLMLTPSLRACTPCTCWLAILKFGAGLNLALGIGTWKVIDQPQVRWLLRQRLRREEDRGEDA